MTLKEMNKAWELYCEITKGSFSSLDYWEVLGRKTQGELIDLVRKSDEGKLIIWEKEEC